MVRDVITDKRNHDNVIMKLASESVTVNKISQLCPTSSSLELKLN